ncbi:MAG: peptide deformylase [Lachnospiraceae bacterium]|nr:peptide deformylase [Lachnospiraceae bacterium]
MALRTIRLLGDDVLKKKAKEVTKMNFRTQQLIADMIETMHNAGGVGLAAPQVGILKAIVVIDLGEGPVILINPEITAEEGSQTGDEGCLSVPGKQGVVTRPEKVTVKALDAQMNEIEITGESLFARAICHEVDHLNGQMYVDLVEGELRDVTDEEDEKEAESK